MPIAERQHRQPPNIVFIFTDSWDGRALGCMGHPAMAAATPNVDRLAERGVLFRNCYSTHPICCPARANTWSGRYSFHCDSWNNYKGLTPGTETFQDRLERAGYVFGSSEGGFGKHDYLDGRHTHLARVTAWTGPADLRLPFFREHAPLIREDREEVIHPGDWNTVEKSRQFLHERAEDRRPFFLYAGLGLPHPAFLTNRRWLERVDLDKVAVPAADEPEHPTQSYQRITKGWTHGFDDETVRKVRAIYYAMCAEVDAAIGRLLETLEQLGLDENTYVVFGSDHGEMAMEHRNFYKMSMYEPSVRVPLIVSGPGVRQGAVVDDLVSLVDLYPTFMDFAGLEPPGDLDGESLLPCLTGRGSRRRDWALSTFTGCTMNTTAWMLRCGDLKYVAYAGYEPQLFDLARDPDELEDLAAGRPDLVEQMDARLRHLVDYPAQHRRVMDYDRRSFAQWRRDAKTGAFCTSEYGGKNLRTYEQILANTYMGYDDAAERQLQRWLDGD
jgi:arylsulfatase K